jgi:hypothetical protein
MIDRVRQSLQRLNARINEVRQDPRVPPNTYQQRGDNFTLPLPERRQPASTETQKDKR